MGGNTGWEQRLQLRWPCSAVQSVFSTSRSVNDGISGIITGVLVYKAVAWAGAARGLVTQRGREQEPRLPTRTLTTVPVLSAGMANIFVLHTKGNHFNRRG